jgi:hypothetical protein
VRTANGSVPLHSAVPAEEVVQKCLRALLHYARLMRQYKALAGE